jgi:hypothetical protein
VTADALRPRVSPSGPLLPPGTGGGLTAAVQVLTSLESTPLPGDGTSTPAFTILHTSQTGHRIIWCSFTGTTQWSASPKPGAGFFASIAGSNFVALVGAWEQTMMVETGAFSQLTSIVYSQDDEPTIANPGAGLYGVLNASLAGNYDLQTQNAAEWSVGAGGLVTYLGNDPLLVLVTVTATVEYGGADNDQFAILASQNGDLIGAGIFDAAALQAGTKWQRIEPSASADLLLTSSRVVRLNTGDTLQALGAAAVTNSDSTLEAFTMTIQASDGNIYDGTTFSGSFIAVAPAAVGAAEEVDIVFQCSVPGGSPDDLWIWSGTCIVADYTPA